LDIITAQIINLIEYTLELTCGIEQIKNTLSTTLRSNIKPVLWKNYPYLK